MSQASSLYSFQWKASPGCEVAEMPLRQYEHVGKAVVLREHQKSTGSNPVLRYHAVRLRDVEFRLPRILRQQKYAHVLPGPWPKKWQHFAERVVGALYLPRAPVNQAEEL